MRQESYIYQGSDLLRLGEQLRNYNGATAELIAGNVSSGDRVLDFGAGFGTLTEAVAARSVKPDCVEPDIRQRTSLETHGYFCYETIEEVPGSSYDVVYSSNVLEHIEDDVRALEELHRVLAPGGKLVLYLPAFQSLYTSVDQAIGHYRRYTIPTVEDRLRRAGFHIERSRYVDVLGYLLTWIFKQFSNNLVSVNPRTMQIYDAFIFPLSRFIERLVHAPFGKNVFVVSTAIEKRRV